MSIPRLLTVVTVCLAAASGVAYETPPLSIALFVLALAAFVSEEITRRRGRPTRSSETPRGPWPPRV
jgi:hypothetical protein